LKSADYYILDIKAPLDANLNGLEFDGATKRNKPNFKVGAAVYCRVNEYSKFIGAKLSCINKGFNTKN
jgi:exosome complex component RRP40